MEGHSGMQVEEGRRGGGTVLERIEENKDESRDAKEEETYLKRCRRANKTASGRKKR